MNFLSSAPARREYFPRGLLQVPGSFRFSADALLLAAFALRHCPAKKRQTRLLDLGCGCGVVGLACLLGNAFISCLGADIFPELAGAAIANADRLGLSERYAAMSVNLELPEERARLPQATFSLVAANMPFRRAGQGRLPQNALRKKALFADENTLSAFILSAAQAIAPDGAFALIYPWDERDALFAALAEHGFRVRAYRGICARGLVPTRCLALALPGSRQGEARREKDIVLHSMGETAYTAEAARFCPWLLCRPWGLTATCLS
ncbi:hypothetical protein FACS1894206_04480 [Deltaproteobacteria bacterium]|nr:hypothetical protein FACS1894206_04480 [Deltaproteobacteria bacterium]